MSTEKDKLLGTKAAVKPPKPQNADKGKPLMTVAADGQAVGAPVSALDRLFAVDADALAARSREPAAATPPKPRSTDDGKPLMPAPAGGRTQETLEEQEARASARLDKLFAVDADTLAARSRKPAAMPDEIREPAAATPPKPRNVSSGKPAFVPPANGDILAELPIRILEDFPVEQHPFHPYTPEKMAALKEDISARGILQPLLVRALDGGRYQIIAGHNRRTAAREAGYTAIPCIIRKMDDNEAVLQMVSTNLQQRTDLLPSEKAWAYRYQLEAMNRQGIRSDLTSDQLGRGLESAEIIGEQANESKSQVRRYVRLTHLVPTLLKRVDAGEIGLTVGATLSFLSPQSQEVVERYCYIEHDVYITQAGADKLRELEDAGELTEQALCSEFLSPVVVKTMKSVKLSMKPIRQYFSEDATQEEVAKTIKRALKLLYEMEGGKSV